jgi:O-6-methylguanine DNA methyltransferase
MIERYWTLVETAWGFATVVGDRSALDYVGFPDPSPDNAAIGALRDMDFLGVIDQAEIEWALETIVDYFFGRVVEWNNLPVRLVGSDFQRRIWETCRTVAYGRTVTYGDLAALAGYRGAARAAGSALALNPAGLLIPCHRVVSAHGIGGYGGRIDRKIALLSLEQGLDRPLG